MNAKNEGLSFGYRLAWRLNYVLLHAAGPATLSEELDPRARMRRERAARVARAREDREQRELQAARFVRSGEPRMGVLDEVSQADGIHREESRRAA
jgi:hypothetical protein